LTAVATITQRTLCPRCGSDELEPIGVVQGIRCTSCSWEGLSFVNTENDPDDIVISLPMPTVKPKFVVEPYESDSENVALIFAVVGDEKHKIAELFWNGAEWLFVPMDKDGELFPGTQNMRHIDVDPGRRMHLNAIAEENLKGSADRHETVQAAMVAALATRRREFRDDTRDLAELGAKIYARGWYPKWREL
jgi:hypothetical protein